MRAPAAGNWRHALVLDAHGAEVAPRGDFLSSLPLRMPHTHSIRVVTWGCLEDNRCYQDDQRSVLSEGKKWAEWAARGEAAMQQASNAPQCSASHGARRVYCSLARLSLTAPVLFLWSSLSLGDASTSATCEGVEVPPYIIAKLPVLRCNLAPLGRAST